MTRDDIGRVPTPAELGAAKGRSVPDVIEGGLCVLFCGINPDPYTAALGHHFARPGNRFWGALCDSGFTLRRFSPHENADLLALGLGLTNMVERVTPQAKKLSKEDYLEGATRLREKIKQYGPAWLAVVGITAYRIGFEERKAVLGPQETKIEDTCIWLLPSSSGANAHYPPVKLAAEFSSLRDSVGCLP